MAHSFMGRNHGKKFQVTSAGFDPGTVRLVTQRLNHYATPGPTLELVQITITCNKRGHSSDTEFGGDKFYSEY